jgi:hypothetical protein
VFFDRSLDCVERDGTDDEKGHRGQSRQMAKHE